MILVNLTCGRNPWKQASSEDSTYRAFTRSKDFLKTILPISDELNDILGRIFTSDPFQRISVSELRTRIMECPSFTNTAGAPAPTQPATTSYVECEDTILAEHDEALSPASSTSDSDSDCSDDDDVSLSSSDSTIDDFDEDFIREQQQETAQERPLFATIDPEEPPATSFVPHHEYVPDHYTGPVPDAYHHHHQQVPYHVPSIHPPMPVHHAACMPQKSYLPVLWDHMVKYVQQAPLAYQSHEPFHHQMPLFAATQGCY